MGTRVAASGAMLMRIVVILCLSLGPVACAPTIDAGIGDAALTAAVKTALLNTPDIDGTLVMVRCDAGVVYLSGVQPSPEAAAQVISIVRAVDGVRDVQSSISVSAKATTEETDRKEIPGA